MKQKPASGKFSDPMPEPEYEAIRMFGREFNEAQTDRSYATGAELLLKFIAIRKDKHPPRQSHRLSVLPCARPSVAARTSAHFIGATEKGDGGAT
jgi:hypothetical protein